MKNNGKVFFVCQFECGLKRTGLRVNHGCARRLIAWQPIVIEPHFPDGNHALGRTNECAVKLFVECFHFHWDVLIRIFMQSLLVRMPRMQSHGAPQTKTLRRFHGLLRCLRLRTDRNHPHTLLLIALDDFLHVITIGAKMDVAVCVGHIALSKTLCHESGKNIVPIPSTKTTTRIIQDASTAA